jgi:hypothetical protein
VIFEENKKGRTYTEFTEDAEITEKRSVAWVGEGLIPQRGGLQVMRFGVATRRIQSSQRRERRQRKAYHRVSRGAAEGTEKAG